MNQEQIQQFLTPDKVKEIFTLLGIDHTTPEAVARQRITQYLSTNKLVSQLYSSTTHEPPPVDPLGASSARAQTITQAAAVERVHPNTERFGQRFTTEPEARQALLVQVTRCEGFAAPDMNGVLTLHMRAGPGRASSRSVPFSDTPNFADQFEMTISTQ